MYFFVEKGGKMENNINSFKELAREAKKRMKNGYWDCFDKQLNRKLDDAKTEGNNVNKVKEYYVNKQIREVNGKNRDDEEFYQKVKAMLLEYGEVSDAIGRLIDKEVYNQMNYEQKQRYTLEISNKYVVALERFKKEKEFGCVGER